MPVRRPACLICLLFLMAAYALSGFGPPVPSWDVDAASGRTVSVTGTVADRQEKNGSLQAYLKDISFITADSTCFPKRSEGIVVKLADGVPPEYLRLGSRVSAKGVFAPFERPRCEGMFDSRTYYMIRGYEGQLIRARITGRSKAHNYLYEGLRGFREKSYDVLKENMSAEDAGVTAAMTLGDRSDLDRETKDLFQSAGISHVLALSGLHIASVGLAVLAMLRKLRVPLRASAVIAGTLIGLYSVMTGLSTSTARAMIMFAISVASILAGRTYDLMSAAALSAVLIIAEYPSYLYDSGFLMSFGAIVGISCIFPVFEKIPGVIASDFLPHSFEEKKGRIPGAASKLYGAVCVTVSVTAATLPVTSESFMQVSLFSVFFNLIVIPLMSVVLLTGFLGIGVGLIGLEPGFILKITHYILKLYRYLGKISEKIDGNVFLTGKPEKWQSITYVMIVATAVIAGNIVILGKKLNNISAKNVDRTGRQKTNDNIRYQRENEDKITYVVEGVAQRRRRKRKELLGIGGFLAAMFAAAAILTYQPRCEAEIRNVDVGQGDCALIWGEGTGAFMIDAGSSDVRNAGTYRILPVLKANRVRTLDYCFLTHMDSDHVSAVAELLEDEGSIVRIKNIAVSSAAYHSDHENFVRIAEAAGKCGTVIVPLSAGDVLSSGRMRITCLSPDGSMSGDAYDENSLSLVLRLELAGHDGRTCFSGLFTGDIGEDVERRLLPVTDRTSYLKVAHHGSRFSSCGEFMSAASPKVSVISVGIGNSYGHPSSEALSRIGMTGSRIYRTDRDGEVTVIYDGENISIKTHMDPLKPSGGL
ncbi:MAG: ComEC/Rec2 family competence protein [Lachnospiraceae bacterium]|nr:ComEC/Rec2 family competence protein [Lachnospiraceae bacterium]